MSTKRNEPWEDLIEQLDDLLEDEDASWAEETLSGIRENVMKEGRCTEPQQRAVGNIAAAVDRKRSRK